MNELFDKQVNIQKDSLKKASRVHVSPQKSMKESRKKWLQMFLIEGKVNKVHAEKSWNQFQRTLGQQFFVQYLYS